MGVGFNIRVCKFQVTGLQVSGGIGPSPEIGRKP
jgi:hypothetical protein